MQAKIWNFSQWIKETDPKRLRDIFDEALKSQGSMFSASLTIIFSLRVTPPCGF